MEHIETWDEMMAGKPDLPNYHPHYARQQAAKGRFKKPEVSTMAEISNHEASEGGIKIMVTGKDFDERLTRLEKKHGFAAGRVESLSSLPGKKAELVEEASEDLLVNELLGSVQDPSYIPAERILTEAEKSEDDLVNGLLKMSDSFYQGAQASKVTDSEESDEDSLVDSLVKMSEKGRV